MRSENNKANSADIDTQKYIGQRFNLKNRNTQFIKTKAPKKLSSHLRLIMLAFAVLTLGTGTLFAQDGRYTNNNADQTLRSTGRVNPSTHALEMGIPLGAYPGRSINVPVSLSYSSKVWRMEYQGMEMRAGGSNPQGCFSLNKPKYSENSASGWTSSMSTPVIEYTGKDNIFDGDGKPLGSDLCSTNQHPNNGYVKRIQIHLPGGASHELRASDTPITYPANTNPTINMSGTYYSVDGSKMKYVESSKKLYLPDGSFYIFGGMTTDHNGKTVRKATKYEDLNGNRLLFYGANSSYPNGYWKDTVNRIIPIPVAPQAPTTAGVVDYDMPSFNNGTMTYKLHWKQLKGSNASNSGLEDFNQSLRHVGDHSGLPDGANSPTGPVLFSSDHDNKAVAQQTDPLFNPIVLTAVELPDGRKYEFSYNIYAEIEKIKYPTGGEEDFTYTTKQSIADVGGNYPVQLASRGIDNRNVRESSGATPYTWTYSMGTGTINTRTFVVTNPDGTKTEREVLRDSYGCSGSSCLGSWGFGDVLTGMPKEIRTYASNGQIISKTVNTWARTEFYVNGDYDATWHPRITKEETILYDLSGNYVSKTMMNTYAGDLNSISNSLDVNLTKEYGFTTTIGGLGTLLRQTEVTHLEYDTTISQSVRNNYKNKQLISLPSKTSIKNGSGTVVAKSEIKYDESGYSSTYRANTTTVKNWINTNNTWVSIKAKYDSYGRVIEATDPKGNKTLTEFSATYSYVYPTKVTTPIPDPSNINGSNTAFETTTVYDMTTGLSTSTTDVNGQTTFMEYNDVLLRPTKVTPPTGGSIVETEYGVGTNSATRYTKVRTQIDATTWKEAYSYYDGLGRTIQTKTIDSNGDIFVDTEYDADGKIEKISNPYRSGDPINWTTNVYDVAGRVKEVKTSDNAKVQTSYGIADIGSQKGHYITLTDQAGKQRRSITDALGNIIRVDEPNSSGSLGSISSPAQATYYSYNSLNNLTNITQGVQTRTFSYDSLSRLISAVNPESGTISYTYDLNGNLQSKTDARSVVTSYAYDNLNRVKTRDYSDSTPDVAYYYDGKATSPAPNYAKGLLTKVSSSVSATEYTSFDNLGRVLAQKQTIDGTAYTMAYTYNMAGELIEQTYPSGRKVKNTLDADGMLTQVQTKTASGAYQNRATNFGYTPHGAISSIKLGNNRWESTIFNNRLQPTQIALGTTQNATNLLKLDYSYGTTNNNGNVLSQTITVPTAGGSSGFTAAQTYSYDSLNRIKSATETISGSQSWKQTYTYDRYGNRNFDVANTTTITGCPSNQCNPTVDPSNNRFSSGQGYTYDLSGNIVSDAEGRTFIYDAENKQKEVKNSSNVTVGTYYYDGNGKRVKKVTSLEEVVFIYDVGGKLVAEYSTLTSQATPTTRYLTNDHLGSPRIITDGSGAVLSRRDFMPFGEELYIGMGNRSVGHGYTYGDSTNQKFTGYQRDSETALDFAQTRYYSSQLGRFNIADTYLLSAVPEIPQSLNRYSYVLNKPLNYIDPTGEIWQKVKNGWKWVDKCPKKATCRVSVAIYTKNGDLVVLGSRGAKDITTYKANKYGMVDVREVSKHHNAAFVFEAARLGPCTKANGCEPYLSAKSASALFNVALRYMALYTRVGLRDAKLSMSSGSFYDGTTDRKSKGSHRRGNNIDLRYMGSNGLVLKGDKASQLADVGRTKKILELFRNENADLDSMITGHPARFGLQDLSEKLKSIHRNHLHMQKTYPAVRRKSRKK